ncbi:MAG: biopolymer transporter ExbD [Vicinamibacteria bacterium]|nr:biopolymer transporter ExbD [Vicinamibacteria bacterium]
MSMSVGEKKDGPVADINVTPMADIMIVLLIIFMVITPLITKGIDVELPKAANIHERPDDQDNIMIGFTRNFTIFFKGVRLETGSYEKDRVELGERLREALQERGDTDKLAFLKADINIEYGEVMKIMEVLRRAGIEEIALISEPKVEG